MMLNVNDKIANRNDGYDDKTCFNHYLIVLLS